MRGGGAVAGDDITAPARRNTAGGPYRLTGAPKTYVKTGDSGREVVTAVTGTPAPRR